MQMFPKLYNAPMFQIREFNALKQNQFIIHEREYIYIQLQCDEKWKIDVVLLDWDWDFNFEGDIIGQKCTSIHYNKHNHFTLIHWILVI